MGSAILTPTELFSPFSYTMRLALGSVSDSQLTLTTKAYLLIALNPSSGTATPSLCQPTAAEVAEVAAGAPAASSAPSNDGSGNVASSDIDGGRALVGDILDDVGSAAFPTTGTRCYH